jgi:hypothetical protein
MRFLPATVIVTLTASLLMALVFVPVLGRPAAQPRARPRRSPRRWRLPDDGPPPIASMREAWRLVARPGLVLVAAASLVVIYLAYATHGRGVDFFPPSSRNSPRSRSRARATYSIWEADALVRQVERELIGPPEVNVVYARTIGTTRRAWAPTSPRTSSAPSSSISRTGGRDGRPPHHRPSCGPARRHAGLAITVREQQRGLGPGPARRDRGGLAAARSHPPRRRRDPRPDGGYRAASST